MKVTAIKTRPMLPPKDDLMSVFEESLPRIGERSLLVVTSKVVAIDQGRCVERGSVDERELIEAEAERYLSGDRDRARPMMLTIKGNTFIPKAGVDTSNANGYYVLWPDKPKEYAESIVEYLRKRFGLQEVGVLIVDSGLLPLRWGTVGISLAHAGFCPVVDYRDKRDIFGKRSLSVVVANVADSLAAAANLVMGEGAEQTPAVVVEEVDFVKFGECDLGVPSIYADPHEDLFAELIKSTKWEKKEDK